MQEPESKRLTTQDRETYAWQLWVPGYTEEAQAILRGATVLVSRVGGLGSPVAYQLAAAGVGCLVLAHGGNLKATDLNRQILMRSDWVGKPRVECAAQRLREFKSDLEVKTIASNMHPTNAEEIVQEVDLVVDCAPLFEERFAMNDAAQALHKPVVECAMYEMSATLTTFVPGKTGYLRELVPEMPAHWKREFPVFGAVSGAVGCLGAMEAIKVLTGLGEPLLNRMLTYNLRTMDFQVAQLPKFA